MKRFLACVLSVVLTGSLLAACSSDGNGNDDSGNGTSNVTIRYLNFKPEIAGVYSDIADAYKDETGNEVIVETAAEGTYESTLKAKMSTSDAPTLFQINGPKGYASWKDYCADLTNTKLYEHLSDKSLAITDDGKVYGIPYTVEGYGIIYNQKIMDAYFDLDNRATDVISMAQMNNFDTLKAVVEEMPDHKDELGIKG
ncbi:MAG: ABC transporter substrate-binding protein, partial [Clostridiales bacterium]|nr:ABC transporter substrate-binding protein [Clostridiales bacterium]